MNGLASGVVTLWNGFFSPLADWSAFPKGDEKVTNWAAYEADLRT
jgi:hypothetical protein